jgi:hypothetical protein
LNRVVQQIVNANTRPRGDCFKACVASVLERPLAEVPHFVDLQEDVGYYWLDLTNGWLRNQGYPFTLVYRRWANEKQPSLWYVKRKGRQWTRWGLAIPGFWIMTVESKNFKDAHHNIVARDDRIVWDPSPRFGQPAYDNRPYRFNGWALTFHVEQPERIPRAA